MKAIDYAEIYRAEPDQREALAKVGVAFLQETSAIMKQRKIQDNLPAYLAVFQEQSDKWKAFARRVNDGIKEDGYLIIVRHEFPLLARLI